MGVVYFVYMQKTNSKAKIYTPEQWDQYVRSRPLPASWERAAGMLKHKRKELDAYLKELRTAWD